MVPIVQKLAIVTLFLLFSTILSLAKPTDPICVPGDTKCLHPEQPLKDNEATSSEKPSSAKAILVDDDDIDVDLDDDDDDDDDEYWERVEEDWEDHYDRHHDRDIDVDID